jgi:hypothetical protein
MLYAVQSDHVLGSRCATTMPLSCSSVTPSCGHAGGVSLMWSAFFGGGKYSSWLLREVENCREVLAAMGLSRAWLVRSPKLVAPGLHTTLEMLAVIVGENTARDEFIAVRMVRGKDTLSSVSKVSMLWLFGSWMRQSITSGPCGKAFYTKQARRGVQASRLTRKASAVTVSLDSSCVMRVAEIILGVYNREEQGL